MMQAVEARLPSAGHARGAWPWYWRILVKCLVFTIVVLVVLFPDPFRLARHLAHVGNMEAMIDADAPELAALEQEVRSRIEALPPPPGGIRTPGSTARRAQREVQRLVYERVAYEWDWNLWGCADYMPTIAEIFAKAAESEGGVREDCDGRAIVAASLMRRLGHGASLATDLRHVWVETREGRWMGPGREKTMESSPQGNKLRATLANVPIALSYGVAVFPLGRELIILLTIVILASHRRMSRRALALGALFLLDGLLFMRTGYLSPGEVSLEASAWPAWVGGAHAAAGMAILWAASRRARRADAGSATGGLTPGR